MSRLPKEVESTLKVKGPLNSGYATIQSQPNATPVALAKPTVPGPRIRERTRLLMVSFY